MKEKFFNLARAVSQKSQHPQHKIGAVIVQKNRPVSIGFNQLKTHRKSLHEWKSIHAEFHAVLGVSKNDLDGATIYVFREHKDGTPAMARPCPSCLKTLKLAGIKKIAYTTYGNYQEEWL